MKQITLLADDKPGVIADISRMLGQADVNIFSLDADAKDLSGVIILAVDKYDLALDVLTRAGYRAISEETLIIAVDDTPGALGRVAGRLEDVQVNIRSLHILTRQQEKVLISLVTDDNKKSAELLSDALVKKSL